MGKIGDYPNETGGNLTFDDKLLGTDSVTGETKNYPLSEVALLIGGDGTETPATVKFKYESNANTNAFTDESEVKLSYSKDSYITIPSNFDFSNIPATHDNSTWLITFTHNLGGASVTIPANVVLDFKGGSFTNFALLTGNNTYVDAPDTYQAFTSPTVTGTWKNVLNPKWFGFGTGAGPTSEFLELQNIIDIASASGFTEIKLPNNLVFTADKSLIIPSGLTVDFNGTVINAINITTDPVIVMNESNTGIKNCKIVQTADNFIASIGANGVNVTPSKNTSNVILENISTTGFEVGIKINPGDTFVCDNIIVTDCETVRAVKSGIEISNSKNIDINNHVATDNAIDGLKTTKNCSSLRIRGGYFSLNGVASTTSADGIDLSAGGFEITISDAICEGNADIGLRIESGELNNPAFITPVNAVIAHITVSGCIFKNNTGAGFDINHKNDVSATSPYASRITFDGCQSFGNEFGCRLECRDASISNCTFYSNLKDGIFMVNSIYLNIDSCTILRNSQTAAGVDSGIKIDSCNHIQINGGEINGSSSDTLLNEDGSALQNFHLTGIFIDRVVDCDNIYINEPIIVNYTDASGVVVDNFADAGNVAKVIIVKLLDIGTSLPTNQPGSFGSTLVKDNRKYFKASNLTTNIWDIERRVVNGNELLVTNGANTTFTIAHLLPGQPVTFDVMPANDKAAGNRYITSDSTNIIIEFLVAPASGSASFNWVATF